MDGLAATRELRARPGLEALPVVAMTANALESDRQRCLDVGMDDHISKPIEPDELRVMVGRWAVLAHGVDGSAGEGLPLPRNVRGLELGLGLQRTGSRARLAVLLRRLASWHRHTADTVSAEARAGNWFAAERAIRIVRQATAMAGAEHVSALAAALEKVVARHEAGEALVEPLSAFADAYAQLIEDLDREHAAG